MIERHAQMRVAEFFAGIGLVRMAIEEHGFNIVWANDIEPTNDADGLKRTPYTILPERRGDV